MEETKYLPNTTVATGTIIRANGKNYIKFADDKDVSILCEQGITKLVIITEDTKYLVQKLNNGTFSVVTNDEIVIDYDSLPENQKDEFNKRLEFINEIVERYKDSYLILQHPKLINMQEFADKSGFSNKKCWKLIRDYFQSGCKTQSLIDNRWKCKAAGKRKITSKVGRKSVYSDVPTGCALTEEHYSFFDDVIKMYLSKRTNSLKGTYEIEVREKYGHGILDEKGYHFEMPPEDTYPTFKQFEYYYYKNTNKQKREIAKTSASEYRNDKRLTISDNLSGALMAGDLYEIDETESDFSLVSEYNPNISVGRAIVHFVIDVYTRRIVGSSISFNNNSYEPVADCMLSMAENGVEKCKSLGITISSDQWPEIGLPNRLRCDRGAEYISDAVTQLMKNLGINKELVTAGTGSLKGQVEQAFHQFQNTKRYLLENKGLITKRHDSKHHKQATISIKEFEKIVYSFIVEHNLKYMDSYPLTKDMVQKDVKPIPIELWNYSIENFGKPKRIDNIEEYKYQLLYPIKAKYTRNGIEYKGLTYFDDEDSYIYSLMIDAGLKKYDFDCKIDRRDVGHIYYLKDRHVHSVQLSPYKTGMKDFAGLSLYEYLNVTSAKKKQDYEMNKNNENLRYQIQQFDKAVIATAPKKTEEINTKNLRENRSIEKHYNEKEKLIFKEEEKTDKTITITKKVEEDKEIIVEEEKGALEKFMERH